MRIRHSQVNERARAECTGPAFDAVPERMTTCERWALALLAAGTVAFLPLALNRFVFPKLMLIALGVLFASFAPARGRLPRSVVAILSAGSLLLLVGALNGQDNTAQLLGRSPRYEGVFVLALYLGACVAGARLLGPMRARGSSGWFLRWLSLAAIAVGVEAALEATGLRPLSSSVARPGSLLGNASDEGAWAVLALGSLGMVALRVGGRLRIAGALAAAVTLVCSGSRGALLGAVVMALVLVALSPRRAHRVAICLGMLVITIGVFALPATRSRVVGSSPLAEVTARGRVLLWDETLGLVAAHPLFGVGPGGYVDVIPAYHDRHYELEVGPANPPDSPHDWVLQAAADGGLLLALLALTLAAVVMRRGVRATRRQLTGGEAAVVGGMLAGLAGYGVALLFHLTSPGTTPLAALFGGALLAETPSSRGSLPELGSVPAWTRAGVQTASRLWDTLRAPTRRAAQVMLVALVIVLAAAGVAEIALRSAIDALASGDVAAANSEFRLAHKLRPWDGEIEATAAHAYATLTLDGIAVAASDGAAWAEEALAAFPQSIQALTDSATIELARGRTSSAMRLVQHALRLDPDNPELQSLAARVARVESRPGAAVSYLRAASRLEPRNPRVWRELAAAYTADGQPHEAQVAEAEATKPPE